MLLGIRNIKELVLVLRAVPFLAILPIFLSSMSMTKLVRILTPGKLSNISRHVDLERTIYLLNRVLRIFQKWGYDYTCLKRSLLLYYFMRKRGIRLIINFGVRWENGVLTGHSWLTDDGMPFSEPDGKPEQFENMFSLPYVSAENEKMNFKNIRFD